MTIESKEANKAFREDAEALMDEKNIPADAYDEIVQKNTDDDGTDYEMVLWMLEDFKVCGSCSISKPDNEFDTCERCGKEVCYDCITEDYPIRCTVCNDCMDEFRAVMYDNNFPGV